MPDYFDLRNIWDTQLPAILKTLPDTGDLDSLLSPSVLAAEYILTTVLGDTFAFKLDFTEPFELVFDGVSSFCSIVSSHKCDIYGVRQRKDLNLADLIIAKTSNILQQSDFEDKNFFMGKLFLARAVYRFYLHPWKNRSVNDKRMKASQLLGGERVENPTSVTMKDLHNVLRIFMTYYDAILKLLKFLKDTIRSWKPADKDSSEKAYTEHTTQTFTERMHMFLEKAGTYLEYTTVSLDTLRFFMYRTRVSRMKGYKCKNVPMGRSHVFCKTLLFMWAFSMIHPWIPEELCKFIDSLVEFNNVTSTILQSLSYDVPHSVYQNVQYMHNSEMLFSFIEKWSIGKLGPLISVIDSSLLPMEIRGEVSIREIKSMYRAKESVLANLGPLESVWSRNSIHEELDKVLEHLENGLARYGDKIPKFLSILSCTFNALVDMSSLGQVAQGSVPPLKPDVIRHICTCMGITDSKGLDVAAPRINAIWAFHFEHLTGFLQLPAVMHMLHQERKKPWQQFLEAVRVPAFTSLSHISRELEELDADSDTSEESTATSLESEPEEKDVQKRKRKKKIKTKSKRDANQTDEEEMEERKAAKKDMKELEASLAKKEKSTDGRMGEVTEATACGHVTKGACNQATEVCDHVTMEDFEALTQAHMDSNENRNSFSKLNR